MYNIYRIIIVIRVNVVIIIMMISYCSLEKVGLLVNCKNFVKDFIRFKFIELREKN